MATVKQSCEKLTVFSCSGRRWAHVCALSWLDRPSGRSDEREPDESHSDANQAGERVADHGLR